MPDLLSAALFERDGMVLMAHRKPGHPPFGARWLLPITPVAEHETAEEAVRRHARDTFGIDVGEEQFVDTVYLEDPSDARRYVANIFRTPMGAGPLRFNADGEYDDARWLGAAELEQVSMPPALREPLIRIMRGEAPQPQAGWESGPEPAAEAVPLAERPQPEEPAPDNRAAWDAISAAYQEQRFGEMYGERLMWSFVSSEDDLHVLDDVRGKRVIVLGCGGGQDCVALARMGAIAVGIDPSSAQIAYARRYAAQHGAANASFVEGTAEDLTRFDDASFDLALSSHALNYVGRIDHAIAEAHRVLCGGGVFAFAVTHPIIVLVSDAPPYVLEHAYWDETVDWSWDFEAAPPARFRQRFPTLSRWFEMLGDAGFSVERIVEPREDGRRPPPGSKTPWDAARARMVPNTIIFKARKR
ncbi:MAG: methyltransferase domain-containing protein [Dehalococcoidia bacterium]